MEDTWDGRESEAGGGCVISKTFAREIWGDKT